VEQKERVFEGLGVSPGIAFGTVHLRDSSAISIPEYKIRVADIFDEQQRLKSAVSASKRQIRRMRTKARALPHLASEEMGFLLDAYYQMLDDSRLVRGADRRIAENRINAESAVQSELSEISVAFASMDDDYLAARMDDIREVAHRLLRHLIKTPEKPASKAPRGSIIIAEELTPADTAQLDPGRIAGFATVIGGAEGHTAIMARALALPAVLGVTGLLGNGKNGILDKDPIIVDGDHGRIIVNPGPATLAAYKRRHDENVETSRRFQRLRNQSSTTRDGTDITLQANLELPVQLSMVAKAGASGIGLLRSEFMFMNRGDLPSEDEQYEVLRGIIEKMNSQPVTVRTLDIGGEKIADYLLAKFGDGLSSALGLRGIRLSLAHTDVLESQIKAILRAGALGPVRILLPMVSTVTEVRRAREIIKKVAKDLKRRKIPIADPLPPIGVMIEVPGAALAADALAQVADFFAIGSNDLTMYTLAVDRTDEQVAYLYNPLHPAILRLIQFSAEAANRAGIPVSICGEIAGDPHYTALLLGLGFRQFSMTASNIPKIKQRIRELDLVAAQDRARVIMEQVDGGRIAMLLEDFNALA